MTKRAILLTLLPALAAVLLAAAVGRAEDPPAVPEPKPPAISDFAWLTGTWVEAEEGSVFTEVWGAPQGDAMIGHDHWTVGGKTRMLELVSIDMEKDGPVLRIRHFHRGLVPWKNEADGPITFPLKSLKGRHVVFEHPTRAWPRRMEYRREGDVLAGKLSGVENGRPNVIPFRFLRRK